MRGYLTTKRAKQGDEGTGGHPRLFLLLGVVAAVALALGGWAIANGREGEPTEAPEAGKILELQAGMPFQILIPAYLPDDFDRAAMDVDVSQSGPGGEPMVQLTYRTRHDQTLFIREWVPVNPDREILSGSRPIVTKWGQGWFLKQGEALIAIWIDVGPLRASIYTIHQDVLSQEQLLAVADTMGPASNRQVFDFLVNPPNVQAVEPPPPLEIAVNEQGVQVVDLIVTPGGYSPLRFSVQQGVPVQVTFRQLGRVGCGNELNFPTDPERTVAVKLESASDVQTFEFTPEVAGEYTFYCAHVMYKGIMTVRP